MLILVLLALIASSYGLEMEKITLSGEKEYLKLDDTEPSFLKCNYKITEAGVSVQTITWFYDTSIALTWTPNAQGVAGDSPVSDNFILGRSDSNLELKKVTLNSMGAYRCDVTTSKGETHKSPEYHLLVIDMPNPIVESDVNIESCMIKLSWTAPAINPKPSPICGIYLPETSKYILTAARWQATPYYNGSIAYRLEEEKFEINQIPLNSVLRCELGMTTFGGRYVQIHVETHNITEINERGCSNLEVDDNAEISYENDRRTCRSEIRPSMPLKPAKATVKCKDGYVPKYSYLVTQIELHCTEDTWKVADGKTWNHYDNLICVDEEDDVSITPKRSETESAGMPKMESSSSSSTVLPWGILFLIVLAGGYGIIAHAQGKKKSHHIA